MECRSHCWHDPLLLADVSYHDQCSQWISFAPTSSPAPLMADPTTSCRRTNDSNATPYFEGHQGLDNSQTSPDLVVCSDTPDIDGNISEESTLFVNNLHRNMATSVELSLDKGIVGPLDVETLAANLSEFWLDIKEDAVTESSFELITPPLVQNISVCEEGEKNSADACFLDGRTKRIIDAVGDGQSLYQTESLGNFKYQFGSFELGNYLVDLHFAEIIFANGPTGMRVFNVFLQERKVVSSADIYARAGPNNPFIVSNLNASVNGDEGLSIRVEGVVGSPILCGIHIRKATAVESTLDAELPISTRTSHLPQCKLLEGCSECETTKGDMQKLQRDYEFQKEELVQVREALENLRRENLLKSRECQEAWKSLTELQNELMRKSMHVGSLAFAVEGQVKEKSKWFSSLRDLTRKVKIMKLEHIKLSEEALAYKKSIMDIKEIGSAAQFALKRQVDLCEDLKVKFLKGAKYRKQLYNEVLELKGNIRVFCRCRTLNNDEIAKGDLMPIDYDFCQDGELTVKSNGIPKKTFKFDAVFGPQADQVDVFQDTAPFATSVLDGYNVCIFAYGQTGSGKTFTMEGTEEARGVNYRILEEMFRIVKEREKLFLYDISVSVLEVYNEQIQDLLVSRTQPGVASKRLKIRQQGEGMHHVPNLVEAHIDSMGEVWEVMRTGSNARAVGSTSANEQSSRSHCIHCVTVKGKNLLNGECTNSKLWLIDLAGSERVAKTEVQGERLKEAQSINRSLSALGDVISALANKSPHIPFRNSKLTHLLQDSLGGDSKTLMFVQISPNQNDLSETLCSLSFASRVRGIELGAAKKQLEAPELVKCKQMVEKGKHDIKCKDVQIKKMEETMQGLESKLKESDSKCKSLQDKVKELESQVLLARQRVDTTVADTWLQQTKEEQITTQTRPPPATRPFGPHKKQAEPQALSLIKDQTDIFRLLTENNNLKDHASHPLKKYLEPPIDEDQSNISKVHISRPSSDDIENNPDIAEQLLGPRRRIGRASMCPPVRRLPTISVPRRNSFMPLPNAQAIKETPPPLSPLSRVGKEEHAIDKLRVSGSRTLSILRRSLRKRIQINSPRRQYSRRSGINVGGMEKVRVSIGNRGRMARRVLVGSAKRMGGKELLMKEKEKEKEKERGWSSGMAGRKIL